MTREELLKRITDALPRAPLSERQREELRAAIATMSDETLATTLQGLEELIAVYTALPEDVKKKAGEGAITLDPTFMTSETLLGLSDVQLKHPATLAAIRQYLIILAGDRNFQEAVDVREILLDILDDHPEWEDTAPSLLPTYDELLALAQFIRLPVLPRTELRDLFEHDLLTFLQNDLDVVGAIDDRMMTYTSFAGPAKSIAGDLEVIITAIRNNGERIGSIDLDRGERGVVPPTIRNWLLEYDAFASPDKPRGTVDASMYLSKSKNAQKLSKDDRPLLEKVIQTVDALLFPERHQQVTTQDRDLPQTVSLSRRLPPRQLVASSRPSSLPSPVLSRGPVGPVVTELDTGPDIRETKDRLKKIGKPRVVLLYDLLTPPYGMKQTTPGEFIAGLELLAEENALERAIQDGKIRERFVEVLRKKEEAGLLEGFKLTPTAPKYVRLFLQWVLEEKARLPESSAAQIAVALANTLRKKGNTKYMEIAYWDQEKNTFVWNK